MTDTESRSLELVIGEAPRHVRGYLVDFGLDEQRLPLAEAAASVDFARQPMMRDYIIHAKMRNFPCEYACASNRDHVYVESWTERDAALELDFDPTVERLASQAMRLWWQEPGEDPVCHYPDLFCRLRGGGGKVVDVKPPGLRGEAFRHVASRTADACASVGWEYHIMGDPDPALIKNLWLLWWHYPPMHPAYEPVADMLVDYVTEEPCRLDELSTAVDDPNLVKPIIWHLLWWHRLACGMHEPILDHTVIDLGNEA